MGLGPLCGTLRLLLYIYLKIRIRVDIFLQIVSTKKLKNCVLWPIMIVKYIFCLIAHIGILECTSLANSLVPKKNIYENALQAKDLTYFSSSYHGISSLDSSEPLDLSLPNSNRRIFPATPIDYSIKQQSPCRNHHKEYHLEGEKPMVRNFADPYPSLEPATPIIHTGNNDISDSSFDLRYKRKRRANFEDPDECFTERLNYNDENGEYDLNAVKHNDKYIMTPLIQRRKSKTEPNPRKKQDNRQIISLEQPNTIPMHDSLIDTFGTLFNLKDEDITRHREKSWWEKVGDIKTIKENQWVFTVLTTSSNEATDTELAGQLNVLGGTGWFPSELRIKAGKRVKYVAFCFSMDLVDDETKLTLDEIETLCKTIPTTANDPEMFCNQPRTNIHIICFIWGSGNASWGNLSQEPLTHSIIYEWASRINRTLPQKSHETQKRIRSMLKCLLKLVRETKIARILVSSVKTDESFDAYRSEDELELDFKTIKQNIDSRAFILHKSA